MTEEYKSWWKSYIESQITEDEFYLPLEPKLDKDWTEEEFNLLDAAAEFRMITENPYGITYFICRKNNGEHE